VEQAGLMSAAVRGGKIRAICWWRKAPMTLADLPHGAKVGTGSLRRRCQLLVLRPDLRRAIGETSIPRCASNAKENTGDRARDGGSEAVELFDARGCRDDPASASGRGRERWLCKCRAR